MEWPEGYGGISWAETDGIVQWRYVVPRQVAGVRARRSEGWSGLGFRAQGNPDKQT